MTTMKSRTYNDAKGEQNEKVCLDMSKDWSEYLKLYEHDINNHYFWHPLLLLFIRLIIAKKQKKLKRIWSFYKQMMLTQRYVRNMITLHYNISSLNQSSYCGNDCFLS